LTIFVALLTVFCLKNAPVDAEEGEQCIRKINVREQKSMSSTVRALMPATSMASAVNVCITTVSVGKSRLVTLLRKKSKRTIEVLNSSFNAGHNGDPDFHKNY